MSRAICFLILGVAFCLASANAFNVYVYRGNAQFHISHFIARTSGYNRKTHKQHGRGEAPSERAMVPSISRRDSILRRTGAAAAAGKSEDAQGADRGQGPPQVDLSLVKRLRQLTSAGYGRCVKALKESDGDLPKAVQWLRKQGAADAAAAAAAAAAGNNAGNPEDTQRHGVIALSRVEVASAAQAGAATGAHKERVAAVQLACDSDFVSRSDVFTAAARRAAAAASHSEEFSAAAVAAGLGVEAEAAQHQQQLFVQRLLALSVRDLPSDATVGRAGGVPPGGAEAATTTGEAAAEAAEMSVGEDLGFLSQLVGENVVLKRVALREAIRGSGIVCSYCHQPLQGDVASLSVLLLLSYTRHQQQLRQQQQQQDSAFEERLRHFGKQLCMHIAATNPLAITVDKLPPAVVAQELQFALDSLNSGSCNSKSKNNKPMPETIHKKILEGKMGKWHKESVLLKQTWALDDSGRSTESILKETEKALNASIKIEAFDLLEATARG